MLSFGFPLILAGAAAAQTTTSMRMFFPGVIDSDMFGLKGSVVGVESSLTTVAFACDSESYETNECEFYEENYSVTIGPNTWEMISTHEDDYTTDIVSMGCSVAPKSAVCTMSISEYGDWEDYCIDSYTNQDVSSTVKRKSNNR